MKDASNKRAVIVGIFVFLGLGFLVVGILAIGNLNETFKQKISVIVLFDEVSGLQKGNNIWFSGVKIGIVGRLEFYSQKKVLVEMKIDEKVQQYIRKDAFVKISTDGLIGNKILIIYGGTALSPEIVEGDTLAVEKTFTTEDMINTLQDNNNNILAITNDFKVISKKLAGGEGTVGKLLNDEDIYQQLDAATLSMQQAAGKADKLIGSLTTFSDGLNKKGTLANELTTDTVVFNSLKLAVLEFEKMADTAAVFIGNLKEASNNPKSTIGVLLHDEESGKHLKETLKNLESSSEKLDEDLLAIQHNFLFKGYFKKKEKGKLKSPEVQ
jgi:phospholipid/cholesterol/gamma-HCH transport system substrate-binding protein